MTTVTELVDTYLKNASLGAKFGMRDICQYIYMTTMGKCNPLDSTVGRMVRSWREENKTYDIVCCDTRKALYQKVLKSLD